MTDTTETIIEEIGFNSDDWEIGVYTLLCEAIEETRKQTREEMKAKISKLKCYCELCAFNELHTEEEDKLYLWREIKALCDEVKE